jgi:hypothetical protein
MSPEPAPLPCTATLPAADSATVVRSPAGDAEARRWSPATRIVFRFAFCYLGGYCIFNGNASAWAVLPNIGNRIAYFLAQVFLLPAQYLAQHLFHVPPPGNQLHPTGSGDTAIDWIALLILFCSSILATAIWTALDRRRTQYRTLAAWLRFLIRLTVAVGMVFYGLAKVFPLQMPPPQISSLSEPLGMHSPMSVLWNFIGLNPIYEMVCGAAELIGGLLLLFRRTALAGALFSAFVVANVLLYNLCFDVPVKLYAGHLLLLSLFLVLPDAAALFRFFWLHQPAAPSGAWVPPSTRTWFRRSIIAFEIAFATVAIGGSVLGEGQYWRRQHAERSAHCDLCSAWTIDSAALLDGGASNSKSLPSPFVQPAVELIINSPAQAVLRNGLGVPTYIPIKTNASAHTLELDGPAGNKTLFAVTQSNPMHLVLTPIGDRAGKAATVSLTSATPPGGYPLLHRGFHWVSEFPYER